jgi:hypothetical protein
MKKYLPFTLGLLVFFPFMNSCLVTFGDYPGYMAPGHSVEFYKSVSLISGGTLSLENMNGNIDIFGWEKEKVEVYAERNISFSSSRRAMWQPYGGNLPKIDIDRFEDFVKIKTSTVDQDKYVSAVDYVLYVPQHVYLRNIVARRGDIIVSDLYGEVFVELVKGEVMVDNFSGSLHVSLGEGSVKSNLIDLRNEDEVRISIEEGDIIVYLQEDIRALIEASTLDGKISNEFNPEEDPSLSKISFQTNDEGAFISLSASKGNILIKKSRENN